jgi:thiol-disulfide isomerase/thioredoxin
MRVRFSLVTPTTSTISLNAKAKLRYRDAEEMLQILQRDDSSLIVLLFTAVNCGPCRLQKRELQRLNDARKSKLEQITDSQEVHSHSIERELDRLPLKVLTIDTERWPHVGSKFQVGKLPCLFLFRGSETIQRLEGLVSAEEIWKHVEEYHNPSDGS